MTVMVTVPLLGVMTETIILTVMVTVMVAAKVTITVKVAVKVTAILHLIVEGIEYEGISELL